MKLNGKKILLISPEPWSEQWVSKHHYAHHLAKTNSVYFLNPPSGADKIEEAEQNLRVVDYKPIFRGVKFLPNWMNAFLIHFELKNLEKLSKSRFDVVWSFDPSRLFNLSKFSGLKICHIVDWNQKFQRKSLAQTTDYCFASSSQLQSELSKFNNKSFFINHGYTPSQVVPINLPSGKNKIKIGYVGNLNIKYLDWKLMLKIVVSHSELEFYFIGPYDLSSAVPDMANTYQAENTIFTGPIPSAQIPSYLSVMSALIMIYKADEFPIQLSNPHKMMEYLGSGKPIISTFTSTYAHHDQMILMSDSNSDLILKFSHFIKSLNKLSSIDLKEQRINFALSHTYTKQIRKIENHIND